MADLEEQNTGELLKNNYPTIIQLHPKRKITGISAILLPFTESGSIDWPGFDFILKRTLECGLIPAVNMDTSYVNLLDESQQRAVLERTRSITGGGSFIAGAFVKDQAGSAFNGLAYFQKIESICQFGGTPVIFQSFGMHSLSESSTLSAYREMARCCDRFIAFELGTMFAPFGKIYSLDVYRGILEIPQCIGAKHSSLNRSLEWQRLALRDRFRPDFQVFTGNDLAIDMVMYGSDYLLGLSGFCPDKFAERDRMWQIGAPDFFQLNDILQYLGFFAFRNPVPAYKHTAAMFLNLRGWLRSSATHPLSPKRPESDRAILSEILKQLNIVQEA